MNTLVILCALWVLAATAPVPIGAVIWTYGALLGGAAFLAVVSMFRRPLAYHGRRLLTRLSEETPT